MPLNRNSASAGRDVSAVDTASWRVYAATLVASLIVAVVFAELIVRFLVPQASMYPRTDYSPEYGSLPYADTTIVHERPGHWRFEYSINEYRYRGAAIPVADAYATKNVVVLGDSYSFGIGVADGEEYPSVLAARLGAGYAVANLGVGGWGLAQEIRRFYDLGNSYQPVAVVLQFCSNDIEDGLRYPVTKVSGDFFTFHDVAGTYLLAKRFMSRSLIQKSQAYNLLRNGLYTLHRRYVLTNAKTPTADKSGPGVSDGERMYIELLTQFARDLKRNRVPLLMIAVNGQLEEFPSLKAQVTRMHAQGALRYLEVQPWLQHLDGPESPEGHLWGARVHSIIGARLAEVVATKIDPQGGRRR